MLNLFANFKESKYLDTIKKQTRTPKTLWLGMPFTVGANRQIKIEGRTFKGPMTFYVSEFDRDVVTLKLIKNPIDFSNLDDPDDEIDFDNNNDIDAQEFTITRKTFEKLLEPDQGDFASASQNAMSPH